jgi:hypothetical protein
MNLLNRASPHRVVRVTARRCFTAIRGGRLVAAGVLCCATAAQAAPPSESRLSVHVIGQYTKGARQIVAAHPRVLKILDTGGDMLAAAREFKRGTPKGNVVLRIYTGRRYTLQDDPAAGARDFWSTVLAPPINRLSRADRGLIDYVEGPNEGDSTPTWGSLQEARWFNAFWVELAPLIAKAGFRPCAFSIPVGNPPGKIDYIHEVLDTIVPALRACQRYHGGWAYHSYTIRYTKDVNVELYYSLRYRQYYSYFVQKYPDLAKLPLILTEGGVDGQTTRGGPGWKAFDAARYEDWLAWFDRQMKQDPYVVGCTLFESGDPKGWGSFEIEDIAPWLADHLAKARR